MPLFASRTVWADTDTNAAIIRQATITLFRVTVLIIIVFFIFIIF